MLDKEIVLDAVDESVEVVLGFVSNFEMTFLMGEGGLILGSSNGGADFMAIGVAIGIDLLATAITGELWAWETTGEITGDF